LLLSCTACVSHSELRHFSEGEFTLGKVPSAAAMVIQKDDLLAIKVKTLDETAAAPFNLDEGNVNIAAGGVGGGRPIIGYLVDSEGFIDFPVLGLIEAAGKTVNELKAIIATALTGYLVNPVINIRFINFRITLSGQVNRPGSYIMPSERVTILDALGVAGDLTPYANRTNVLIVREQDGERSVGTVNLLDKHIFDSPFFYLRQNDFVYVDPLPEVTASVRDQSQRILPWVSLVTSVVTLTLALSR
jgi:polysaccharide export outer membrane protein